ATFAQECALQGIFLGVNPHYLLASAEFRSGIKDDTVDGQIGPYRVTQTFWDANGSASDLEIVLDPKDINSWRLQVLFAALGAFRAQNRLLDQLGSFPSAMQLYREQWSDNAADLPAKLQAAFDATAGLVDPAIVNVVDLDANPADSSVVKDVEGPASAPREDLSKPVPTKGEELFLAKSPLIMERLVHDFSLQPF